MKFEKNVKMKYSKENLDRLMVLELTTFLLSISVYGLLMMGSGISYAVNGTKAVPVVASPDKELDLSGIGGVDGKGKLSNMIFAVFFLSISVAATRISGIKHLEDVFTNYFYRIVFNLCEFIVSFMIAPLHFSPLVFLTNLLFFISFSLLYYEECHATPQENLPLFSSDTGSSAVKPKKLQDKAIINFI